VEAILTLAILLRFRFDSARLTPAGALLGELLYGLP
jgi:hypothetical protein